VKWLDSAPPPESGGKSSIAYHDAGAPQGNGSRRLRSPSAGYVGAGRVSSWSMKTEVLFLEVNPPSGGTSGQPKLVTGVDLSKKIAVAEGKS